MGSGQWAVCGVADSGYAAEQGDKQPYTVQNDYITGSIRRSLSRDCIEMGSGQGSGMTRQPTPVPHSVYYSILSSLYTKLDDMNIIVYFHEKI